MAENVTQPVPGQAFLEFELSLPKLSVPYTQQLTVPDTHRITETVFGYGKVEIGFRVRGSQYLDKVLKALDANGQPLIRWRIGQGTGETVSWLPWQTYYVRQYSAMFEGAGNASGQYIKLICHDLMALADRASKTKAHRGPISSILQRLAADNNLTDTVIEETAGEGLWIQSYEGDFEFARKRLLARATSKRGRGNFFLFMRDNALHFHTIEYQTKIKDLIYMLSPATTLEAIDVAQAKVDQGSAGVRVVYHDPYSGESKEIDSDPGKAIRLGNTIPRLDKINGAPFTFKEHLNRNRDDNSGSIALAQNAYEAARSECFQLKLQTSKTPFLRPGEILRIDINPTTTSTSAWSGLYLVATASHLIKLNALSSVYTLQRGEQRIARNSQSALAANGVDTLQEEQNAPGYDLNVREAQSSSLTKGGKSGSGQFLTVRDKSKALAPKPTVFTPPT